MAAGKRVLEVVVSGKDDGASKVMDKTGKSADDMGGKLGGIGKAAAVGLAGAAAGIGLVAVGLKGAYDAAEESAKISRETERVITTTGGAAKVSADHVGDLSTAVSNLTGVDDEYIQSGANLLLTFTNIRNEAGKGNDIFDQATSLALDMSKALGTDLNGASIQLGKALNDPIKGITALSRSGVSFTEQQKEQIKALVKSGDTLGAQKVILGELSKEFGGAAAAAADPFDRLKVTVGNLQEQLGGYLIPIVEEAADWLGKALPVAVDWLTSAWDDLMGGFENPDAENAIGGLEGYLLGLGATARTVFEAAKDVIGVLQEKWDEFFPKFQDGLGKVGEAMSAAWGWLLDHKEVLYGVLGGVAAGLLGLAAAATVAAIAEAAAAAIPILIVAALGALVGAVIYAYNHWTWFHDAVQTSVKWLQDNVPPAWEAVKNAIQVVADWLTNTAWPAVQAFYEFHRQAVEALVGFVQSHWAQISSIVSSVWDNIVNTVQNAWTIVSNLFDFFGNIVHMRWADAWQNILNVVGAVWNQITSIVSNGWDVIKNGVLIFGGFLKDNAYHVWDALVAGFKAAINAIIGGWNNLHLSIPKIDLGPLGSIGGGRIDFPDIPYLHTGGVYRAATPGGEGLAMLLDGERVLPPGQSGAGRGGDLHIHVNGSIVLERDLINIMDKAESMGYRRSYFAGAGAR